MSMSSTEFTVGMGDGRNSSKVLKPPGGGDSNIFGHMRTEEDTAAQQKKNETQDRIFGPTTEHVTPSKVDRNKSDIFNMKDEVEVVKQGKRKFGDCNKNLKPDEKGNETQDRIFGPPTEQVTANKADRNKSDIFNMEEKVEVVKQGKKTFVHRNPITGETVEIDLEKNEEKETDEDNNNAVKEEEKNGDIQPPQEPVNKPTSVRVRQPPGGKSSGIF